MRLEEPRLVLIMILTLAISHNKLSACSMYKVTDVEKTMVGCNHDAWSTTPKIWFENAEKENEYGAAFTGSREVSSIRTTPQSGMNTEGLVFSRLTSYYPTQTNPFPHRLKIENEADYLSDILHQCATVKEVKEFIDQYDHSFFLEDVFIYVDSLGNYLIVEPYGLTEGNQPNYVLANFCPSITDNQKARKLERYRNGEDYLNLHKTMATIDFCTELSDTMSVCRRRNGDGTLITSIFDTKERLVSIYFYHNFDTLVQYSLASELSKGDHSFNLPEVFPKNSEFERLVSFKTPSNTIELRILLVLMAGLLALISFALLLSLICKNRSTSLSPKPMAVILLINMMLIAYIAVLITNNSVFYFDVPYTHYNSSLISASSYIPFLLLLSFIPILMFTTRSIKSNGTKYWMKASLVMNNAVYLILLVGFGYWGLYSFWK